ncbi:RHS domain-containing protein [Candidatus Pacearchaeota archaeon]|nr:RHS domain-containing protein [Candidatus Pacearchaeota archaeon]
MVSIYLNKFFCITKNDDFKMKKCGLWFTLAIFICFTFFPSYAFSLTCEDPESCVILLDYSFCQTYNTSQMMYQVYDNPTPDNSCNYLSQGPQIDLVLHYTGTYCVNYNKKYYWDGVRWVTLGHVMDVTETPKYQTTYDSPVLLYSGCSDIPPPCSGDACYSSRPVDVNFGSDPCPEADQGFVGNPINILNGNKYEEKTDLSLPSSYKGSLSFTRAYNSQTTDSDILGYGWSHSYSVNLTPLVMLDGIEHIRIKSSTGRGHYFKLGTGNRWDGVFKEKSYVIEETDGTYTWYKTNGTKTGFNDQGQLAWQEDAIDNRQTFNYVNNRLETITDVPSGRVLTPRYKANNINLLDRIEGPVTPAVADGIWVSYGYDGNNNLISATYADGSGYTYEYTDPNDSHNLTVKKDAMGHTLTTWGYDDEDRAVSSISLDPDKTAFINYENYESNGTIDVTDAYDVTRTYTITDYDVHFPKITSISGPGGCQSCAGDQPIRYDYDANLNITEKEYANGTINTYANYDERGKPGTVTLASGTPEQQIITYTYHPVLNSPLSRTELSVLGSGNKETTWDFDDDYNATANENPTTLVHQIIERGYTWDSNQVVVSYEDITKITYTAKAQVESIDGPLVGDQDKTTFVYHPDSGDLVSVTAPLLGSTTFMEHDGVGNPMYTQDINGNLWYREWDGRNRPTLTPEALIKYTLAGDIESVTDNTGRTVTYTYEPVYGRLDRITDNAGNYQKFGYDDQGNVTSVEFFDSNDVRHYFHQYDYQSPDHPGKLWKNINSDGTATVYDYNEMGRVKSVTDETDKTTLFEYDPLGRVKRLIEPGTVLADTHYLYDSQGNLTELTDAEERKTSFIYDDRGNRLQRIAPHTGTTVYSFDDIGRLYSKTDNKDITTGYSHDILGRLVGIDFPTDTDIVYGYDQGEQGKGKLTYITDGSGSSSYSYDMHGNQVREVVTTGTTTFTTDYSFDKARRPTSITYPSGRVIGYERDANGQISKITSTYEEQTTTLAENTSRLPFGPTDGYSLGNGINLARNFDQLYRMNSLQIGELYHQEYEYSPSGNITGINDQLDPTVSQSYVYDDLGHLKEATGAYGAFSYTYDKVGNRLTKDADGQLFSYEYDQTSNRLLAVTGEEPLSFSYDENGNPTSRGNLNLTYNNNNRLIEAADGQTQLGNYLYNAQGLRVAKTVNGQTTRYIYDASGKMIAESDENGTILVDYVYFEGNLLSKFDYLEPTQVKVLATSNNGRLLAATKIYAFTEAGRYTGLQSITDEDGAAYFALADFETGYFQFRANYLGGKYWSEAVSIPETLELSITVPEQQLQATVTVAGEAQQGVKVYLFDEEDKYLGVYLISDENGQVAFDLPTNRTYKLRANYLGNTYWSETVEVNDEAPAYIEVATGGGSLTVTLQQNEEQSINGVTCYLFSSQDKYLGMKAVTDEAGQASFAVSAGEYKIRGDYLGYKFWADLTSVENDTQIDLVIPHQQITVTVNGDYNGDLESRANQPVSLFTPADRYLSQKIITDQQGQATFSLPEREYKLRVNYLKQEYWSDNFTWTNPTITIPEGMAIATVVNQQEAIADIKVHAFNESARYLNLRETTDETGKVTFRLPAGNYNFRADYLRNRYFSGETTIIAGVENPIAIQTGGGEVVLSLSQATDVPLVGVRCFLFNQDDKYLGQKDVTDDLGHISLSPPAGDYSLRIDYLGYQFWTDLFSVPETADLAFLISHQQVNVNIAGIYNEENQPLIGAKAYLFSEEDKYLGRKTESDDQGQTSFSLPDADYKIRVDYLRKQYWADLDSWTDLSVLIPHGKAIISVNQGGENLVAEAKVLVYSDQDKYLGIKGITDENGQLSFTLPTGSYTFRTDYLGSQFWSSGTIVADQENEVTVNTGGGSFSLTVNKTDGNPLTNVKVYLFSEAGKYLGQNSLTNEQGQVSFDLTDGSYKFRVNYLGSQFWTEAELPELMSEVLSIEHHDVTLTANSFDGFEQVPLAGQRVYLFTEKGKYLNQKQTSDENGQVTFNLPDQAYKLRVNYLKGQYWTDTLNIGDNELTIDHGQVELIVRHNGEELTNVPVYLFNEAGKYLGRRQRTNEQGIIEFTLPTTNFKFRIDYNGSQYWSDSVNVLAFELNNLELNLDQLALNLTNDPAPVRVNGEEPLYQPGHIMLAADGDLTGMLSADSALPRVPVLHYVINDHLGTPQMLVDEQGEVVWHGNYDPFGKAEVEGERRNLVRFPGQYYDSETGLHYNWHRYYDPATGRFMTPDPIGLRGNMLLNDLQLYRQTSPPKFIKALKALIDMRSAAGHIDKFSILDGMPNYNLYSYTGSDPINFTDPTGEFKPTPGSIKDAAVCAWGLTKCASRIEELREECQKECADGDHGGSMPKCAVDKCWDSFQDCLKFALPMG